MSKAFVTIGDERFPLAEPASFDYDEAQIAKKLSGGMGLGQLEAGLVDADPDSWLAVAFVSKRRVDANVTQAQVLAALRKQPLIAVLESMEVEEDGEAVSADPPGLEARPSGGPGWNGDAGEPQESPIGAKTPAEPGARI